MDIFQSIILGLIQGLTEFLPISSSGHLVLMPWFFDWQDPGLVFDVALHFGTLLAVLVYFGKDYWGIIKSACGLKSKKQGRKKLAFTKALAGRQINSKSQIQNNKNNYYPKVFLWWLVLATIPGALAGYFLENYAETVFRFPLITAGALFGAGLILYLADRFTASAKHRNFKKLGWRKALVIGLAQAVAIIPGISRSGATITAGLFLGLNRVSAARFSFMLSGPVIFGASLLKFPDFVASGLNLANILGILAAAVSGYLAIAGLIKFVEKVSYKIFFWYRAVLALIILSLYFLK